MIKFFPLILLSIIGLGLFIQNIQVVKANSSIVIQTAHGGHGTDGGIPIVSLFFSAPPKSGNLLIFGISSDALTVNSPTVDKICAEPVEGNTCNTFTLLIGKSGVSQFQVITCALGETCDSEIWFGFVFSISQIFTVIYSDTFIN